MNSIKSNNIALYKKIPQYSGDTLKRKSISIDGGISNTIKGEFFYTTGWTMPELLCAFLLDAFARAQIIERCRYKLHLVGLWDRFLECWD